jgi:hypothetical protein
MGKQRRPMMQTKPYDLFIYFFFFVQKMPTPFDNTEAKEENQPNGTVYEEEKTVTGRTITKVVKNQQETDKQERIEQSGASCKTGRSINTLPRQNKTLVWAIKFGTHEDVEYILQNASSFNANFPLGTQMTTALAEGPSKASLLMAAGARINALTELLHLVAFGLKRGLCIFADAHMKRFIASRWEWHSTFNCLVMSSCASESSTVHECLLYIIDHMLSSCPDINALDYSGEAPLHTCASVLNIPALKFLCVNGADPFILNQNGATAREMIWSHAMPSDPRVVVAKEFLSKYERSFSGREWKLERRVKSLQGLTRSFIRQYFVDMGCSVLECTQILSRTLQLPDNVRNFLEFK